MENKSKKANIPVTVLVLLTIALLAFTLLSFFLGNDNQKSKIEDFDFLDDVYTEYNSIVFLGGDIQEKLVIEDYDRKLGKGNDILKYRAEFFP